MKINDTISVNPSKTALGHVDNLSSTIFRQPVLGLENHRTAVNVLNIAFPTVKSGLGEYMKYSVPLRTLFATILIVTGIAMLTATLPVQSVGMAVCSLVFGGFLALGLLTRPVMLGASVFYCILGALSLRAGAPDIALFSLMFGCVVFAVIGAGKYSCDELIRGAILRFKRNREEKRKEDTMGYKVFHTVRYK